MSSWSPHYDGDGWLKPWEDSGQVIIAAGGKALLRFDDCEPAKAFAAKLSRKVLTEAQELELAVAHHKYQPGELARAVKAIQQKMALAKLSRKPSVPLLGLSVTAPCQETGMPAVTFDEGNPIARGIEQRRNQSGPSKKTWKAFYDTAKYDLPDELDDLGRTFGEKSTIGVVHMDGNGLGRRFADWLEQKASENIGDDAFADEYRALSEEVRGLFQQALVQVFKQVQSNVKPKDGKHFLKNKREGFELQQRADKALLPIRPVVLGGDDMTFICDGRVALELTATALKTFISSKVPAFGEENIFASAGVAIVKSHSPFSRTYILTEQLCSQAKQFLRGEGDRKDSISPPITIEDCALNWQIGLTGLYHPLLEHVPTYKPYKLQREKDYLSWEWLAEDLLGKGDGGFRSKVWQQARNKLKELGEFALRGPSDSGMNAIEAQLNTWNTGRKEVSKLRLPTEIHNGFFHDERGEQTPILDGLELLDLHLELN